jgi:hypothetical protein
MFSMDRVSLYKNKIIFILICFFIIATLSGCDRTILTPEPDGQNNNNNILIHSYVLVKGNPDEIIKDCTPELSIFTDMPDVAFMSFSGDGSAWSGWVEYRESYDNFNIASGLNGTAIESGYKTVYIRFKGTNEIIFPKDSHESVCCHFEYEIQELFSIEIKPQKVELNYGESQIFVVKGFDRFAKNEIPLDGQKIRWEKTCGSGNLNPTTGLKTIYNAPKIPGTRDISAHYGSLGTGAWVVVLSSTDDNID